MVTLTRDLYLVRSRFLTGLTAVSVTRLHQTAAWHMRAFVLFTCRHDYSPFANCVAKYWWDAYSHCSRIPTCFLIDATFWSINSASDSRSRETSGAIAFNF